MSTSPLLPLAADIAKAESALQVDAGNVSEWQSVASAASGIADALRNRNGPVDNHTHLGESSLPKTIGSLLKLATTSQPGSKGTPLSPAAATATFELLRVGANLCSNHDRNRQALLDAEAPSTVADALDAYWRQISTASSTSGAASMDDLRVIKTAIGFLLNASVGFEPVRSVLLATRAPLTILRLSTALYVPGAWATTSGTSLDEWKLRSGLSAWSWQAIETLKANADDDEGEHAETDQTRTTIFDSDAIPPLVGTLQAFIPPFPSPDSSGNFTTADRQQFVKADSEVLGQVSMLLESLVLDSEEVRLALAAPSSETPLPPLSTILDFVEKTSPPSYWGGSGEKSLGLSKGAVIKAIVIAAGEDRNMTTLWDASAKGYPGGWFVEWMAKWIKTHTPHSAADERDDLVICATLSLGNLARKPAHCIALLAPPISLAPHLLPLLQPNVDIKVKHGVLGLLKHLSQPSPNKEVLGSSGFIEALATSGIWERSGDIAEVVQNSAISVAKHLSYYNAANALKLVNSPTSDPAVDSALDQILDLVRRSDTIALQSEGTRVLVNVVKGLFSLQQSGLNGIAPSPASTATPGPPIDETQRQDAIKKIASLDSTEPLAEMIGRSGKYPMLLNEAVVSLTLLSSQPTGLTCVLQAIVTPLPYHILPSGMAAAQPPPPPTTVRTGSDLAALDASTRRPSQPLNVLEAILRNPAGAFPPELGANVCTLLASLGKGPPSEVEPVKMVMKPVLEELVSKQMDTDVAPTVLHTAMKKTLEAWAQTAP